MIKNVLPLTGNELAIQNSSGGLISQDLLKNDHNNGNVRQIVNRL